MKGWAGRVPIQRSDIGMAHPVQHKNHGHCDSQGETDQHSKHAYKFSQLQAAYTSDHGSKPPV